MSNIMLIFRFEGRLYGYICMDEYKLEVEIVCMDIVSKFKVQGVIIEKTKSRNEIFTNVFISGSTVLGLGNEIMAENASESKKPIDLKSH